MRSIIIKAVAVVGLTVAVSGSANAQTYYYNYGQSPYTGNYYFNNTQYGYNGVYNRGSYYSPWTGSSGQAYRYNSYYGPTYSRYYNYSPFTGYSTFYNYGYRPYGYRRW